MDEATRKLYDSIAKVAWPVCPRSQEELETASPIGAIWRLMWLIGTDLKMLFNPEQLPDVRDADLLPVLADLGDVLAAEETDE